MCAPVLSKAKCAHIHIAGTPCTDFSTRGSLQGLEGKTTEHLFAWIGHRLLLQEPFIVQENVLGFVTSVLVETMGHLYSIEVIVLDPTLLGWPVARQRKYTLMKHKGKTGPMAKPLNEFGRLFLRPPGAGQARWDDWWGDKRPVWDVFFVAGPRELQAELLWASSRPQSCWKEDATDNNERPSPLDQQSFFNVLTVSEREFLAKYIPSAPQQVYQLNQNPDVTGSVSNDDHLATLIKNSGVLWPAGCMLLQVS